MQDFINLVYGVAILVVAFYGYLHSRENKTIRRKMSRLTDDVTAVENLVTGLNAEIATLKDSSTGALDQAGQDALAERLEALLNPAPATGDATADPNATAAPTE